MRIDGLRDVDERRLRRQAEAQLLALLQENAVRPAAVQPEEALEIAALVRRSWSNATLSAIATYVASSLLTPKPVLTTSTDRAAASATMRRVAATQRAGAASRPRAGHLASEPGTLHQDRRTAGIPGVF